MKNTMKRGLALLSAGALTALSSASVLPAAVSDAADTAFPYTIEAEDMEGASCWTQNYGPAPKAWSGEGFFYLTNETASFNVTVPEDGMYNISIKAIQVLNEDGREQTINVNGEEKMLKMAYSEDWVDFDFGLFRLNKGENTISFPSKYGYMAIDTVTVSVADKHDYSKATSVCCDPKATAETKALMKYLQSVYGSYVISGQQEIYGSGHKDNYEWENEYIEGLTGELPAIRGLDFMNYNPLYGWDDGTTERAISWVKDNNGIITASWHINVPIDFENYELGQALDWKECTYKNYQASNSTFNTANVLVEDSKERAYFELAMEDLAEQLLLLQEANVPIIFRPLHEAQGNDGRYGDGTAWFWWGDRGSEVYVQLWHLLYETLTEKYGLHNIIWEFNAYELQDSKNWYPGDEYVDIVAYDKYNAKSGPNLSAISGIFHALYSMTDGTKMVAMAENDTIPAMSNMSVEDAMWLYVCPWYDGGEDGGTPFLAGDNYQDKDNLIDFYQNEKTITLDKLPADLYGSGEPSTEPTTQKPTDKPTDTPSGDILYGDANDDGKVDLTDSVAILQYVALEAKYPLTDQGKLNADVVDNGSSGVNASDALALQMVDAKLLSLSDLPTTTEKLASAKK